jgi:Phage Mu protein F like protein
MITEDQIKQAITKAIKTTQGAIDLPALIKAIESKDIVKILEAIGIVDAQYPGLALALNVYLQPLLETAYIQAAEQINKTLTPAMYLHAELMQQAAIKRIILDSTKGVIYTLSKGLTQNLPASLIGAQIRHSVGMTEKQAASLMQFTNGLQDNIQSPFKLKVSLTVGSTVLEEVHDLPGLSTHQLRNLNASQRSAAKKAIKLGLTEEKAQRLIDRQAEIMLEARAQAIATAENTKLVSEAQHSAVEQLIHDGKESNVKRFWVTAGDERVRHDHTATATINSKGVGMDQPFQTPLGVCHAPPLEIGCRCHVEYRRTDGTAL